MKLKWEVDIQLLFYVDYNTIVICTKPRTEEEIITRASVAFKQFYKNVEFENVSGDICNQQIDAIGKVLTTLFSFQFH